MLCLVRPTNPAWVEAALRDLDAVLIDHAHCEMKAAMNALSLSARAPNPRVASLLADLAEEEASHFREVVHELETRGLSLGMSPKDVYAESLRAVAHRTRPKGRSQDETLIDRFLVAALIEARSCERFRLLADALTSAASPMAELYERLFAAEARHYRVFVDLATEAAKGDAALVKARLAELAVEEASLCATLGALPEIHG
jgi:tRNA-(ms[2]io[6]A)-hydroxylase